MNTKSSLAITKFRSAKAPLPTTLTSTSYRGIRAFQHNRHVADIADVTNVSFAPILLQKSKIEQP